VAAGMLVPSRCHWKRRLRRSTGEHLQRGVFGNERALTQRLDLDDGKAISVIARLCEAACRNRQYPPKTWHDSLAVCIVAPRGDEPVWLQKPRCEANRRRRLRRSSSRSEYSFGPRSSRPRRQWFVSSQCEAMILAQRKLPRHLSLWVAHWFYHRRCRPSKHRSIASQRDAMAFTRCDCDHVCQIRGRI